MSMSRYSLLVLAFILAVCVYTAAQPKDANSIAARNASDKATRDLEAERVLKARRANAQSLLINLAADARNFTDQALRARTQARIADVLWEVDRERSRTMFRSAWDAAEVADAENWARVQEDIRQQQAKTGSGGYVMASPPDLRKEVLRLAAKHDRTLGEELLAKFKEQKAQEATDATKTRPGPFGNSDDATRQRFDLARQLLEAGDTERAMQFADPVLGIPGMPAIDFLSYLREKNPVAADQRYAAMLASAAANPQSDANTVSLLSSYLFTPHVFIAFVSTGTYTTSSGGPIELPAVAPELRLAFFSAASSILMRPLAPPGQEQTSSGHDGDYLVIKRLLPLFEQYAPPEMTTALRAQLEALSSLASKGTRERDDDDWVRKGIRPDKFDQNWEQSLLDRLDHAKTSAERDQINFQLANFSAAKSDLKARDYVSKIDDTEMRNGARAYIDASMTLRAIEKKDAERALEIVRNGELTHLQKSWAFSQSAKLLAKTDRERALALIEDAAAEARRIENSDPDRPRAFFAVTNALFLIDRKSAWQVIDDAIRSANSAEDFNGEDGQLTFRMITKGMRSINQSSAPDFDVTGIFDLFAREDYEKAVELARGFQHAAPRASATIVIARSVLEEKKK
jgi:hypothetical protein